MTWADDFFAAAVAMAKTIHEHQEKVREARRLARNQRQRTYRKCHTPKPKPAAPQERTGPMESCECWRGMPPCSFCTDQGEL